MDLFVVVCVGIGKHEHAGKPIAATFGIFKTQREAAEHLERVKSSGPNRFATDEEWFISCDRMEVN